MSAPAPIDSAELETPPVRITPLPRSAQKLISIVNNQWRVIVPRGVTREMLTASALWSVCSQDMTAGDLYFVQDEARSYFAILLCLDCGRGFANMHEVLFTPLPALVVAGGGIPPNFEIRHQGLEKGYCVVRLSDGVCMGENFTSYEDARQHLLSHATLR